MNKIKRWAIDVLTLVVCIALPLFSISASWVIVHRLAEIVMQLHGRIDLVVTATVFSAVVLVWLNNMVIDTSMWIASQAENTKKDLN